MSEVYAGQEFDIAIECTVSGLPMTTGQSAVIQWQKADKTEGSLAAAVDNVGHRVTASIDGSITNQPGALRLQPVVTIDGLEIPGTTIVVTVKKRFT